MHPLAQRLLTHIRRDELLNAGDRAGVAVSGGIDSVALLRLLLELRFELGIVLSIVHFNHKLRGEESDADEEFVRNLAREHDLEFYVDRADVGEHARETGVSIETAARELRYRFFQSLIRGASEEVKIPTLSQNAREGWGNPENDAAGSRVFSNQPKLDIIATGHTLDDQAETVLMRIIRGAGMRGLAAIYPRIDVEDDEGEHCGEIVRPLLETRRCELEGYLKDIDQCWREDSTNAEHHFTRNRVRRLLVPLLEKEFNPKIAEGLSELAGIARAEEDYWENEVAGWMGTAVHWSEAEGQNPTALVQIQPAEKRSAPGARLSGRTEHGPSRGSPGSLAAQRTLARDDKDLPLPAMNASLDRLWFVGEPVAVQRRLTKAIAEEVGIPLEFKHVDEIVRFASENGPPGKKLALPLGWKLLRESVELRFLPPDLRQQDRSEEYEYSLPIPGHVMVPELNSEFDAQILVPNEAFRYELDALLDAQSVPGPLTIRNWHAGDRFRPAHTKSAKKLKELLTDLHITHVERATWPVVVSGNEIVWVRGFPVSYKYRAQAGRRALLIRETTPAESA